MLFNMGPFETLDIFAHTSFGHQHIFRQHLGIKVKKLRLLLRGEKLSPYLENELAIQIGAWDELYQSKRILYKPEIKLYNIYHKPMCHFAIANGDSLHIGFYKPSMSDIEVDKVMSYIVRSNTPKGQQMIQGFVASFENIWENFSDFYPY